MSPESYNYIFGLIEPIIQKQNTQLREAIPANKVGHYVKIFQRLVKTFLR